MFTQEQMLKLWQGLTTDAEKAQRIAEAKSIEYDVCQVDREIAHAKKDFEKQKAICERNRRIVQEKCPHWLERFIPGEGNDSFYSCELCGVVVTPSMRREREETR